MRDRGLLLFAHGCSDGGGAAIATRLKAEVEAMGAFDRVGICFSLQEPRPAQAIADLGTAEVAVVPLLTAEGRLYRDVLPGLIAMAQGSARVELCPPVGCHPAMPDLAAGLATQAAMVAGIDPADATLVVAGHGSKREPSSALSTRRLAAALDGLGHWKSVAAAFLSEAPPLAAWQDLTRTEATVVLPFFISGGHHETDDVPRLLRAGHALRPLDGTPYEGRRLVLADSVGRCPYLVDLVLESAQGARAAAA